MANVITYNNKIVTKGGKVINILIETDKFITTWDTTKAGSANTTIVIPTTGAGYDCVIEWGDGGQTIHKGTPGNITHVYAASGTYTVKISGLFPRIHFNASGDCLKLKTIAQWGNIVWSNMSNAFNGCANMTGTYIDVPNTTTVASMDSMFTSCSLFNSPVNFNTTLVTNMSGMFYVASAFNQSVSNFNTANVLYMNNMFRSATAFNQSVSNFNTAKVINMYCMFYSNPTFNQSVSNFNTTLVTNMGSMFEGDSVFNQDVSGFNVSSVTSMTSMFAACHQYSTANYDALLISWGAQSVQNNVTLTMHDGTKYTAGGAAAARLHLTTAVASGGHGWTITDGGPTT
jgi:surface protein